MFSFMIGRSRACPSCGNISSNIVDRKYIFTELRRCRKCNLMYRIPTIGKQESYLFYQDEYSQGITTELPGEQKLKEYTDIEFKGTEKDYSCYIQVLKALNVEKESKIFDYGCSWGYGSWQLKKEGYDVDSLEISRGRAAYAREKLGIDVFEEVAQIHDTYDVFFSSHVLEHVSSVRETIMAGIKLLKPGGLFIAFTPNGSSSFRERNYYKWHKLWGLVHPNFLDDEFYKTEFKEYSYIIDSSPYNHKELKHWAETNDIRAQVKGELSGGELVFIARIPE